MTKLKWTAGPWGLELGDQALCMERCAKIEGGFYTAVKEIAGSRWEGTDGTQFIRAWRKQMSINGLDIDESVFARTIRQIAHDKARRFAYAVVQDMVDPVPEGQRVFESTKTYEHHAQIKRAVRRLLTPSKSHPGHLLAAR